MAPLSLPSVGAPRGAYSVLLALLTLSCLDLGAPVPEGYEARDVGRLLGCENDRACWSRATDVNESGLVIGDGLQPSGTLATYAVDGDQLTVLWTRPYGGG